MKINWVQILIGVIVGIVGCFYLQPKPKQAKIEKIRVDIHDTTWKYKDIASTSDAKTRYVPSPGIPGIDPSGNILPGAAQPLEKVSYFDTNDVVSGFWAHIEYWHSRDQFKTNFHIPIIVVRDSTYDYEHQTDPPVIVRELPAWELGIGINARLFESKLLHNPFVSLTYNKKILFFNTSLEFRGLADFKNGSIGLSPEVEGKMKITL